MTDTATAVEVDAGPGTVFALLADYWRRPVLLPPTVTGYTLDRGRHGAGTWVCYRVRSGRRARERHLQVTEPAPGRVLDERDANSGLCTRWSVQPLAQHRCRVHVHTSWEPAAGLAGWVARRRTRRWLHRMHASMLDRLARQATVDDGQPFPRPRPGGG